MGRKRESNTTKPLTKKRFEDLLTKAAQPVSKESAPGETGTSASRLSGGYTGRRRSPGKTEGKEGSPSD